jgi:hypothetical protein
MSNKKNNNLKDFLQKSDSEPLDDFEKDALQGFYSLGSEQEALDAKEQLDKRIYAEVFIEKKSNQKIYWLAAAGLFLVIGLSVFFVLNNNNFSDKKNMALVSKDETKKTEQKLEEEPAAEKIADKQNIVSKEEPLKNSESIVTYGGKSSRPNKSARPETASGQGITVSDKEEEFATSDKKAADISSPTEASKDRSEVDLDDIKTTAAEKKSPGVGLNEQNENSIQKLAANAPSFSDELKKEAKAESKGKRKKESQKSAEVTKSQNLSTPENDEKGNLANNRSNIAREDNSYKTKQNGAPAAPSVEPSGKADKTTFLCYYKGGENNLLNDVREKLIAKKLNMPFEVSLFISDKKIVEKVSFTKLYKLNKDDEIHIAEILKSLTLFDFSTNPSNNGLYEYKFLYKP